MSVLSFLLLVRVLPSSFLIPPSVRHYPFVCPFLYLLLFVLISFRLSVVILSICSSLTLRLSLLISPVRRYPHFCPSLSFRLSIRIPSFCSSLSFLLSLSLPSVRPHSSFCPYPLLMFVLNIPSVPLDPSCLSLSLLLSILIPTAAPVCPDPYPCPS